MEIEEKTANTVLQEAEKLVINGKEYHVEPPSIATLMLVGKELAVLPKEKLDNENAFAEVFKNIVHGERVAKSMATMILGAKKIKEAKENQKRKEEEEIVKNKKWSLKFLNKKDKSKIEIQELTSLEQLTEDILNAEIRVVLSNYMKIMQTMQVNDFFLIITFLTEITMTKPTKEVIKTTVSGR